VGYVERKGSEVSGPQGKAPPVSDKPAASSSISVVFGFVSLTPYRLVTDSRGRLGQQYLRVDHDREGREVLREVLEPVAWLNWE
jgi:hypothetical protein